MSANNNSLPNHIGREAEAEALGKTWRFSRWTRGIWFAFAEWARTVLPDPVEVMTRHIDAVVKKDVELMAWLLRRDQDETALAQKEGRPPILMAGQVKGLADELASRALNKGSSYLSFTSPEIQSLLNDPFGQSYLVYLLLRDHHGKDVTPDIADDLVKAIPGVELQRILKTVQGEPPGAPKNAGAPAASA